MKKRLFTTVFALFLLPALLSAAPVFKEGRKVWRNQTSSQYDTQLSSAHVRFSDALRVSKNPGVDLGPVGMRLDEFFAGDRPYFDFWVRIFPLPNIYLDNQVSVQIVIDHIWDLEKNDIYKHAETLRQSIQDIPGDEMLTFISKLYLTRETKTREIREITGTLVFYLPLKLEVIPFDNVEVKSEKIAASGRSKIKFARMHFDGQNTWVEMRYQGNVQAYLTALAYDKAGKQLAKKGFAKNSVSDGWLYVYSFAGEVEKIQTLLSSRAIEREYPFKIKP